MQSSINREKKTNVSISLLYRIRIELDLTFARSRPIAPLNEATRQAGVRFAQLMKGNTILISFSDEFLIRQNLNRGGVWKFKGEVLDEKFFETAPHVTQVIVLSAIDPDGYKSRLMECGPVTAHSYCQFVECEIRTEAIPVPGSE